MNIIVIYPIYVKIGMGFQINVATNCFLKKLIILNRCL